MSEPTESTVYRVPVHPSAVEGVKPDQLIQIMVDDLAYEVLRVHRIYDLTDGNKLLEVAKLDLVRLVEGDLAFKIPKKRVNPNTN